MIAGTIPEGTWNSQLALTGDKGDQFVVLKIVLPKELSEEACALYQQLAELQTANPRTGLWS